MDIRPVDPALVPDSQEFIPIEGDLGGTLSSVTIETPNGHQVEVAPPAVSTINLLARIFADDSDIKEGSTAYSAATLCMYIVAVDGIPQARPTNLVELQILQNKLLDSGLSCVGQAIVEYFPMAPKLKVLKKNLR